MKKLTIQQICNIYPKDEYVRENNTFIKGNIHCISKDQIIEEFDDCWITLSHPIEIVGEIVNAYASDSNFWRGHYYSNIMDINILFTKMKPTMYFMHHQPQLMEAAMYQGNPVIKARFRFYSVIVKEVEEVVVSQTTVLRTFKK
jgi:hypothetical protein